MRFKSTTSIIMKTNKPSVEQLFGSKTRMKIIKSLAQNEELTISLIINKTKSNHTVVIKHLQHLIELGLIQEKKFGRIKVYRYRYEDIRAQSLARFIEIWELTTERFGRQSKQYKEI